jgi:hypothetical protein
MTIETTLERIATALETMAANSAPANHPLADTGPKETRKRRTSAASTSEQQSTPASEKTVVDSTPASDPATDDLFGEEKAPVKEETKKATIEQVKAALVSVQTALKHKDHALKILGKHTVPKGEAVLSKLPESAYAALIAEAAASIKAGKVS